MSPASLFNVRAGWQRFHEPNIRQHEGSSIRRRSASHSPPMRCSGARAISRCSTSLRCPTSGRTSAARPPTASTRCSRRSRGSGAGIRCAPATTCGSTAKSGSESWCGRRQYMFRRATTRGQRARPPTSSARTSRRFLLGIPTGGSDRAQRAAAERHAGTTACSCRTTGGSAPS